jgi:integral membrane protein
MTTKTLTKAFRAVALLEAVSWLGLLTGMYFKYIADTTEVGVKVFGPIHGTIFIGYVLLSLLVTRRLRWPIRWTALLALAASVPPFATVAFEVWAQRTGRLADLVQSTSSPAVSSASTSTSRF